MTKPLYVYIMSYIDTLSNVTTPQANGMKRIRSASDISISSNSKIPKFNIFKIEDIFTPNNIVYSNIKDGDKQLNTFTDYRTCLNFNDFNSYCYNNSISDNAYSFSMKCTMSSKLLIELN